MGYWRRAASKDIECLLGEFADAGWVVVSRDGYYNVRCPCGEHQRWIHLTPSDPNYVRNALSWLRRQTCYGGLGDA